MALKTTKFSQGRAFMFQIDNQTVGLSKNTNDMATRNTL